MFSCGPLRLMLVPGVRFVGHAGLAIGSRVAESVVETALAIAVAANVPVLLWGAPRDRKDVCRTSLGQGVRTAGRGGDRVDPGAERFRGSTGGHRGSGALVGSIMGRVVGFGGSGIAVPGRVDHQPTSGAGGHAAGGARTRGGRPCAAGGGTRGGCCESAGTGGRRMGPGGAVGEPVRSPELVGRCGDRCRRAGPGLPGATGRCCGRLCRQWPGRGRCAGGGRGFPAGSPVDTGAGASSCNISLSRMAKSAVVGNDRPGCWLRVLLPVRPSRCGRCWWSVR